MRSSYNDIFWHSELFKVTVISLISWTYFAVIACQNCITSGSLVTLDQYIDQIVKPHVLLCRASSHVLMIFWAIWPAENTTCRFGLYMKSVERRSGPLSF